MTRTILFGFACLQAVTALSLTQAGVQVSTPLVDAPKVAVPATPSADSVLSHVEDVKAEASEVVSQAKGSGWFTAPVKKVVAQKVPAVTVSSKEAVLSKVGGTVEEVVRHHKGVPHAASAEGAVEEVVRHHKGVPHAASAEAAVEEVVRHHKGVPHAASAEDEGAEVEETVRLLQHTVPALTVSSTDAVVSQVPKVSQVLDTVKASSPVSVDSGVEEIKETVSQGVNTAQTTASSAVPAQVEDVVQEVHEAVRQPILLPALPVPLPSTDPVLSKAEGVQTATKAVLNKVHSTVPVTETVEIPAPVSAAIEQVHEAIRNLLAALPVSLPIAVPSTDALLSKVGGVKNLATGTLNKVQTVVPVALPVDATGTLNTVTSAVPPVQGVLNTVQVAVRQPSLLSIPSLPSTDSVLSKVADVKNLATGTLSNAKATVSAVVPVPLVNVQDAVLSKVESVQDQATGVVSSVQGQAGGQVTAPVEGLVAQVQEQLRQPHTEATATSDTTVAKVEEVKEGSSATVNQAEDNVTDSVRACFHEEAVHESVRQPHDSSAVSAKKVQPLDFEEALARVKANLDSARAIKEKAVNTEVPAPVQAPEVPVDGTPAKEELRKKFLDVMRRQRR